MKTIFHCDDMGATHQITMRILEAWRKGLIDSFSIIANGDALEEVVRGLNELPKRNVRIAVHLNLSEGKVLTASDSPKIIADINGNLICSFTGLIITWLWGSAKKRKILLDEIEKEWWAQILKVQKLCLPRKIDALDGHIHVHMIPFLFPIAARLAKTHGIPEIRISREDFYLSSRPGDSFSIAFLINTIKYCVLRTCSRFSHKTTRKYGLGGPEKLIGILYTGRMSASTVRSGIRAAKRKGTNSAEILFHIGRASKDEAGRWAANPDAGTFPLDKKRDDEFIELVQLRGK